MTLAPGARLELNGQPLIVGGQLITNVTGGTLPIIVGGAAGNSFIVTGVNVNGLVLNAAPLTINGTLTRFDNVSFSGFAPEAIQLTVNSSGLLTHFPMNGLSFASQPTSGQYISATDTQPGGALLIIDVTGAVPADGSAFTLEAGGAEVNWLGNPGEANLAVTQTVAPVPAAAGTRLTYAIMVTNGGPIAAADVVLNEQVPLGATGVLTSTPQGSCTAGPIGVSCALGTIPAGRFGAGDGVVPHDVDRHAEHDGRGHEHDAGRGDCQQHPHDQRGHHSGGAGCRLAADQGRTRSTRSA